VAKLLVPEVLAEDARQLLTETMLADRWLCLVVRLQRWRTVGEGTKYLKIVGKVFYRLKDIQAYEVTWGRATSIPNFFATSRARSNLFITRISDLDLTAAQSANQTLINWHPERAGKTRDFFK
jgi:hypothetical protein